MFGKATEIRRRYSAKAEAKAEAKGRNEERERFRAELFKRGIKLTEDDEEALFNSNGRENWKSRTSLPSQSSKPNCPLPFHPPFSIGD